MSDAKLVDYRYRTWMRIQGVLNLLAGLVSLLAPAQIFYVLNLIPNSFKLLEPLPAAAEPFWLPWAASLMFTQSALCFMASYKIREHRNYAGIYLISLLSGVCTHLYFLFYQTPYFAHLAGMLIDLFFAIIVLWGILRLAAAGPTSEPPLPVAPENSGTTAEPTF